MTFKGFEEIEAWKLAKDWELKKQIKSSSGSAMDCIAEGYERGNNNEFVYFLGISKGSSGEVRSQAYRALDYGYITESERVELDQLSKRIGAAVQGLIDYLNQTNIKGQRYHKKSVPGPNSPSKSPPSSSDHFFPSEPPP